MTSYYVITSVYVVTTFNFGVSYETFNPLSANFTKWSNTLKQFVGKMPTNCLNVFDDFVGLAPKGLKSTSFWLQNKKFK